MKVWAVAVVTVCQHGQSLYAGLAMAPTRNDAITQGVSVALSGLPDQDCPSCVTMTQATHVSDDLIEAAAADLRRSE